MLSFFQNSVLGEMCFEQSLLCGPLEMAGFAP